MSATAQQSGQRPRRADAERSVVSILDAAIDALAENPETSMSEIARRAGVVRATVYVHFPTREALIAAITDRAMTEATEALRAAAPNQGEPGEALARLLAASWRVLGRYHALVAINSRLQSDRLHALHKPVARLVRPVLERGQASGAFNSELPLNWMQSVVLELVRAASRDVSSGRLSDTIAERTLIATVSGALAAPTTSQPVARP